MEKNIILAIVLSVVVLVIYNIFFMPQLVEKKIPKAPEVKEKTVGVAHPEEGREITLENSNVIIKISTKGGRIVSWYLKHKKKNLLLGDTTNLYLKSPEGEIINLSEENFRVKESSKEKIVLYWEKGKSKLTQTISLPSSSYYVVCELLTNFPANTEYFFNWPNRIQGKTEGEERLAYWNFYLYKEKKEGIKSEYNSKIKWLGIRQKKDFLVLMVPLQKVDGGFFKIDSWGFFSTKKRTKWIIYAGPQSYTELRLLNKVIKNTLNQDYHLTDAAIIGFWGYLSLGIIKILILFYNFTHSYGIAIILLTLLIYGALSPLTFKQFESMQKMQVIQPELKEIQKKFKNDPKRLQAEMMKIYSKHKVNPMSGCLPMIIQLPIIFILYRALLNFNFAENPSFLWIKNLGKPDIPLLLALGGCMFLQQRISQKFQTGKEQEGLAKMMQFFPLFLILILWSLPSGVMLYWFTSTLISILQQFFIAKRNISLQEKSAA